MAEKLDGKKIITVLSSFATQFFAKSTGATVIELFVTKCWQTQSQSGYNVASIFQIKDTSTTNLQW